MISTSARPARLRAERERGLFARLRDSLFPESRRGVMSRAFEGGGGGRRWLSSPAAFPANSLALAAGPTLAARARHAVANNPYAAQAARTLASALVGAGIKPQSPIEDEGRRAEINRAWETWTDNADAEGAGDFQAMQYSTARSMVINGEALIVISYDDETGALRLRLLNPDQLDHAMNRDLGGGARIVSGVEFDEAGRRVAYHIFPDAPDLPFAASLTPLRVEARDVIHLFERQFPGQVRGVSWFAPVLLRLAELDKTEDAQQMRQQIGAMLAGFIIDQEGGAGGFDGDRSGATLEGGLEPGTMKVLSPGQSVEFSTPPAIGAEAIEFMRFQLRGIAAGLGVTYEQLTGDYSATNYSSARASLIEFRRRIEAVQHHVIIFQLCRPVWRRWMIVEQLAGRLPAPRPGEDEEDWFTPKWITPGWAWVDPAKEIAAQREAVDAGFMSRREVVAGRGVDIEQLDAERNADAARAGAPSEPTT